MPLVLLLLILLFVLFGNKKSKSSSSRKKTSHKNSFGERMDRLTRKGELPWGWYTDNGQLIKKIEAEHNHFLDAYFKSKRKGIKAEYAALKSLILHMEDVQKLCKRKGECFALWSTFVVANPKDIAEHKARLKALEAKLKTAKK